MGLTRARRVAWNSGIARSSGSRAVGLPTPREATHRYAPSRVTSGPAIQDSQAHEGGHPATTKATTDESAIV